MANYPDAPVDFDVGQARRELGLMIKDVAALTHRTRVTVWRWERDKKCPPFVVTILRQQATIRALGSR